MKNRTWKKICLSGLIVCFAVGMAVSAKLQQASMPYDFPLTSDDEEWKELTTTDEMVAAYQIPEETLKQMRTKALVNTVLSDTFLTQFEAYNTSLDAMRMHRECYNIYPEMESRADYYEVLAGLYKKARVLTEEDYHSRDVSFEEFGYLKNLEILIAADIYGHGQDVQARAGREQWDAVVESESARIRAARAKETDFYNKWSDGFVWFYEMLPPDARMDEYTESLLERLADTENYDN